MSDTAILWTLTGAILGIGIAGFAFLITRGGSDNEFIDGAEITEDQLGDTIASAMEDGLQEFKRPAGYRPDEAARMGGA